MNSQHTSNTKRSETPGRRIRATLAQRMPSTPVAAFPGEGDDDSAPFPAAILYPTLGSVMMYLGPAASPPSLRRSFFTTSRSDQPLAAPVSLTSPSGTLPSAVRIGFQLRPFQ